MWNINKRKRIDVMKMLKEIVTAMRPKQWYKNLILFVGIVFSVNLLNFQMWLNVLAAFALFSLLSGSEYILNDILDFEQDRKHPTKSKRPIASGKLKKSHALFFALLMIIFAGGGSYLINKSFFVISVCYLFLILLYSLFLKYFVIVDLLVISVGFVIRAIAGCLAINLFASPWLIVCAFLLALFLALCKRRHELVLLGEEEARRHRRTLEAYSTEMLDQMIGISSAALIISYSLYTFLADDIYLMLTIPFPIYGLFRYLFLVHAENFGGETEMIFKDKGMVLCLVSWAVLVVAILYAVPEAAVRVGVVGAGGGD